MGTTLTIRDETAGGKSIDRLQLEFPSERITIRELIRERVYQEVQDYNRRADTNFHGLVRPTDSEQVLNDSRDANAYRLRKHRVIDWHDQFDKALDAFKRNGFFILVDNKQAEDLDEEVVIRRGTEVTFVKLVPLVGG
jgi:hypothetical protein